jgi:hypothetical protein
MNERRRAEELLALRAVEGLAAEQDRELAGLLGAGLHLDVDGFDTAAAALDQAMTIEEEPLPALLRERVLLAAREAGLLGTAGESKQGADTETTTGATDVVSLESRRRPAATSTWVPWLAAAAATLAAIVGWWPRAVPTHAPEAIAEAPVEADSPAGESPLAAVESSTDRLVRPWSATEDPTATAARGEVIWSTDRQDGFMRISGLAPNDPSVEQYQLWIFDRTQDERYPIDGGVFDIPAGGAEALVPIHAKIAVEEPYLFAVTVEKPGGVVVSSRERIALLAEV